ncbi:MAG: hypothetical protein JRJ85_11710 [Deltaproteobacteria bacterium]|nr:hypothetical protein [Deltaproteobacteria bacterium]
MSGIVSREDQRKDARFRVQEGTFVSLNNQSYMLGNMVNVSRSGLSFEYVPHMDRPLGTSELDIFIIGHVFRLIKIPFSIIFDLETDKPIPFSSNNMRRCGVQFRHLMPVQSYQLDYFIRHYTM